MLVAALTQVNFVYINLKSQIYLKGQFGSVTLKYYIEMFMRQF